MPQVSAEVRWFLDATNALLAAAFGDWFESGEIAAGGSKKKAREDVYALEQSKELGVKGRGGKPGLEVKSLVAESAAQVRVGSRIATVQIWTKVSSQLLTLPAETRIVSKKRRLRKFDATQGIVQVPLGEDENPISGEKPAAGCNIEWTEIEVPGSPVCWTFGMESFSFVPGGDQRDVLVSALEKSLQALDADLPGRPELGAEWNELSYPAWLNPAK